MSSTEVHLSESESKELIYAAIGSIAEDQAIAEREVSVPSGNLFCKCAAVPAQHELRKLKWFETHSSSLATGPPLTDLDVIATASKATSVPVSDNTNSLHIPQLNAIQEEN
jgi:hypothetical protein